MDNLTEYDQGPLTWVKSEIDVAFNAATTVLLGWNGKDQMPLKEAVTHLHQVSGALRIVDLLGVHQVNAAIEYLLSDMQQRDDLRNTVSRDLAVQAIQGLRGYLDSLMAGGANTELALTPLLASIQTRRGAEAPAPGELFFPDVSRRARRTSQEPALDGANLARVLRHARAKYQKGLLFYLQGKDPQAGLLLMIEATDEVAQVISGSAQYTFWWAVSGMLDAVRQRGTAPDRGIKSLLGRIDLQLRRLTEGSFQLAERLIRDVLFCLLPDDAPAGRAGEVRAFFELERYRPVAEVNQEAARARELRPLINRLREALAVAKEHWLRLCAGRKDSLEPFRDAARQIQETAIQVGDPGLGELARAIRRTASDHADAADAADAAEAAAREPLQVEMATTLLLLQHGAENFFKLGHDFGAHAELQSRRLDATVSGETLDDNFPGVPLLDEIARQAQEKLLLTQVSHEIQVNLRQIEEILDKFFRNNRERAGLPLLPGLLKQVQGAFNMLQMDIAAQVVQACIERIGQLMASDHSIEGTELNWLAEAISTLGLYIEALRHGRDDPSGLRTLLQPPEPEKAKETRLEAELAACTEKLRESLGQLDATSGQPEVRAAIKQALSRIAQDADLVGDGGLREQADEALRRLAENAPPAAAIESALQPTRPGSAEVTPVETAAPTQTADNELLEIYIEEAGTVLAAIAESQARLHDGAPQANDFVDIRRGFHTLKGSGRMVGLSDLAEVAWEVEQTMNQWLREERPPNAAILDLVEQAATRFHRWVGELVVSGAYVLDAGPIVALARKLRGETASLTPPANPVDEQKLIDQEIAEVAEALAAESAELSEDSGSVTPEAEEAPLLIGQHAVPAPLFAIFCEEAALRLAELRQHLAELEKAADEGRWNGFARAAHTLAGISRTTGLTPLAEAAHGVETWALAWRDCGLPMPEFVVNGIAEALDLLADGLETVQRRAWPEFPDDFSDWLASLHPENLTISDQAEADALAEAGPEDAFDPQLLPIFLAEADELLPRIGDSLRRWRVDPQANEPCHALQRALHTLKGSARMAGAMRLGAATHALETRVAELNGVAPDTAFLDSLEHEYDVLAESIDGMRASAKPAPPPTSVAPVNPQTAPDSDATGARHAFKAKASTLDALINEAGEISIARSRIEAALQGYKQTALELTVNVDRLRDQLRELEIEAETQIGARLSKLDESHFDPLEFDRYTRLQELTRMMAESVNDVSTAQENLLAGLSDAEYAVLQQSRSTRGLQHQLMDIRMVRLNSQSERLHRVVRQAAKEMDRKAHLHIEGGDTELDRIVLDKAMVPFEHLLRNAVAHGIEPSGQRLATGKAEFGEIRLSALQEGTEVVLTLSDDGAGLNLDKTRVRAEAMGWLKPGEKVERERLESFLFMPGFTTVDAVNQIAGRGVGLDVVRSEIAAVGGRIRVDSEPEQGTRFTIRLPASLALAQVVLVNAGDQVYAIPAGMVVLVREVRDEEWQDLVKAGRLELDSQVYPLRSLAELTDQQPQPNDGRYRTVMLLRSGDERVALRVDRLSGNYEAVVKAIGPQLARVPGVAGATILADGRVAFILNPYALMEAAPARGLPVIEAAQHEDRAPLVLVVDDSLTVRKITGRLLQRAGYRVATAKDGVEALERMQEEVPVVVLLDIEMPRMDGFEVARHMRADSRTRELPIIMITSRTAEKHREHAGQLGVNLYMGKPYQEEALLAAIAEFASQ